MRRIREQFTTILDTARLPTEQRLEQDFALVLNAPPEVAQGLDDIRRRYDPAFKVGILPHITLKRPSPLGLSSQITKVAEVLAEGLRGFGPFQVQLDGYGVFKKPGSNVVYLKVRDEQPFCNLHSRVIAALSRLYPDGLADQYEGDNFHPHLTIANELDDLDLAVLEHELATGSYRLDFSFTLEEVTLFVHQADQPWEVAEILHFSS